jgi:ABC-2 type transport system ATP-binding protein
MHGRGRMPECAGMIEVRELTKRYGGTVAVDGLSFTVQPGQVTGFLGPNGSGKTTTMRVILGLDAATSGRALINGRGYAQVRDPLRQVGALLDAAAIHPHRRAVDHLRWLAASNRIGRSRVAACLEQVGLAEAARTPAGEFSLGMKQRLGIAGALLGDPGVLLFDEPVNGLDPEGVRWIRGLLRELAGEGRTILLSSHLMSEMALTADHLVIIGRGRLTATTTPADLAGRFGQGVLVRAAPAADLAGMLEAAGATVTSQPDGALLVGGLDADAVGELAAARRIPLRELTQKAASLEDAYLALTAGSVTYRTRPPATPTAPATPTDPTTDPTTDGTTGTGIPTAGESRR